MKQESLTDGFERYRKKTRKERFLDDMEVIIPWKALCEAIEPFYPNPKGAGRRPIGIERMLRIHFLQHWFNLSDPVAEEALYDSRAMRRFVGIDLGEEPVPDETTICKFRHLMEQHNLGDRLFHLVNQYLDENGMKVHRGTLVDASIINAPSSTKNKKKQRDPEMHQTRKGNQWLFGMKVHIGVDSKIKLIHSVVATPANVHDSAVIGDLLHGEETRVWVDSAYTGKTEAITDHAPNARDFTQHKGSRHRKLTRTERERNRNKSRVRAKVEHVFGVMKGQFGFTKVRYKGLSKNAHCPFVSCALVNLVMAKKPLLIFQFKTNSGRVNFRLPTSEMNCLSGIYQLEYMPAQLLNFKARLLEDWDKQDFYLKRTPTS
jgi:IS5 family transposase